MIETLEAEPEAGADALGPAALLASIRSRKAAEDQRRSRRPRPCRRAGPTSTHPSPSTPPRRSPSPGVSTRSPSPDPVRRWWRSSASPSSAPSWAPRACRRRSSSATPSSCRHRLPRLWAQVHAGRVPAWRARAVAEVTIHSTPELTIEAAQFVDAQVAAVAGKIGPAQLDRLVAETIKRFDLAGVDPASDPEDGYLHVDPRHVTIHDQDVHFAGTVRLEAEVDLADGLDLHQALAHGAATQKALGSEESLDARRAKALGDLARTQTALDLHAQSGASGFEARSARTSTADGGVPDLPVAREVVLHAHFDASLAGDTPVFAPTGRLEEGQRLVLLDQLKSWCTDSRTKITVKPVIDLNRTQVRARLCDPGPDPRPRRPPRPDLRVPVVHPPSTWLRRRPRHRARPRRRSRRPTTTRPHRDRQPGGVVPVPPPAQDPHRLALRHDRARSLRVDLTPRPPLPPRPHRHHRTRPTRPRSTADPVDLEVDPAPHPANREEAGLQARPQVATPSVETWSAREARARVAGEARPAVAVPHPDLGHRHPEGLGLAVSSQHHVSHLCLQHRGVTDDHDAGVDECL